MTEPTSTSGTVVIPPNGTLVIEGGDVLVWVTAEAEG